MRDRDLVRLYWPTELRPAFDALMDVDDALADVVISSTQPALGAIRLAWWREALERLDHAPPPPEPRLQAVAEHLLPRGVSGAMVAGLERGWAALLEENPDLDAIGTRGTALFNAGATLLDKPIDSLAKLGRFFAFADAKRRGLAQIGERLPSIFAPQSIRPLTIMLALADRDLRQDDVEPEATPGRAWTLLKHRVTGRLA